MSEAKPFDPETASLDELRAVIGNGAPEDAQAVQAPVVAATSALPVVPAVSPAAVVSDDEEEKTIYQRRIDLGDGSGVQVFSADSLEGLVDKLTDAQLNATKKIREQSEQLKAATPRTQARERTADEEFVLSQELMTKPTKAFEKLFQETTGFKIGDFKSTLERATAYNDAQTAEQSAVDFVSRTPDFYANPANGERMKAYLKTYQLAPSVDNWTKAFHDLSNSGLLQVKPADAVAEVAPQVAAPVVAPVRRGGSGLSTRGGAAPAPAKTGPTEDELYSMPLDQLKELSQRAAGEATS